MEEIKSDLKEIKSELKSMSGTLLRNTMSLELHERRTSLLEKRMEGYDTHKRWEIGLLISSAVAFLIKVIFLR